MSLEAVLSRIGTIESAQQQLASPTVTGAAMTAAAGSAAASTLGTSTLGAPSSRFANALASAQTSNVPSSAGPVAGAVIPQTAWNPEHKPIAAWIAPVLQWASQHGWSGSVTSGYRTYQQQQALNASGTYSANAGKSNHETTQYPGGAVDVTDPAQLLQALKGYTGPDKLVGGVLGAVDPEHFSATGH